MQLLARSLTLPNFGLQPLQSTSLTALGATAPVATVVAVLAVAAAVAAPAVPVRLSWQMTARPIAGTQPEGATSALLPVVTPVRILLKIP